MLDNRTNHPPKFRTKNLVEINNDSRGTYSTSSQIEFKTSLLKYSLCDYSELYVIISTTPQVGENPNDIDKEEFFENCVPFADCISKINNTQINNAKDTNVVMLMYNLIW